MRRLIVAVIGVLLAGTLLAGLVLAQGAPPVFLPLVIDSGPDQATPPPTATAIATATTTATATPTATVTRTPTPTPTATPGGGLAVENYQTYVDGQAGGLHVIGEIVNGETGIMSFLRANITLLQNGQPVYNQTQTSMVFALRPGERAPFDASLGTPPNYTSYTIDASGQTSTSDPVDQFTILSQRTFTETTNTLALVGELRNDTGGNVTFVTVTGTFYQASGLVWRAGQSYTMLGRLAAGQRTPFKLTAYGPTQIASEALIVRALNTSTSPRGDLTVVSSNVTVQGTILLITGQVRNDGATSASSVQVVASLFDGANQIVNAGLSGTSTLTAGASGPFSISIPNNWQGYTSVELQVQGN